MATRYLAIVAKAPDALASLCDRAQAGLPFQPAYEDNRMVVMTSSEGQSLAFNGGIVIGHLFSSLPNPKRLERLSDAQALAITGSNGSYLIDQCWGGYVAVLSEGTMSTTSVLRDPSGMMPCLHVETSLAHIFSSDINALIAAGFVTPSIDFDFLAFHLRYYDLRTPRTAITGVAELPPGYRATVGSSGCSQTQVWDPWRFAAERDDRPFSQIAASLRTTVSETIEVWGRCFSKTLLGVSGGLDSSIIAACLQGSQTPLTCYTNVTDAPGGDERAYARCLTNALGLPLTERYFETANVDFSRATSAHLPLPVGYALAMDEDAFRLKLARENNIDAFFTGIGGDNVFCSMRSSSPFLDRLLTKGPTPATLKTLAAICALTDAAVTEVLTQAYHRIRKPSSYRWVADERFLLPRASASQFSPSHPWLEAPSQALPGKAAHIAMLVRLQATMDLFPRANGVTLVMPLLSQPIVEACLRIPTWTWITDGIDRALARRAFETVLPTELVHRKTKGSPISFGYDTVAQAMPRLRALLLEGILAEHRLLDTNALAAVLNNNHSISPADLVVIFSLAEAEAWLRHWSRYCQ